MKKNILKATLVAAFALIAGINVYNAQKSDVMSEMALANVDALAQGEVIVGMPCACVPNSTCIYFYPDYFEIPGAFHN